MPCAIRRPDSETFTWPSKARFSFALNAVGLTFIFFSHYDPPIAALSKAWGYPEPCVRIRSRYP